MKAKLAFIYIVDKLAVYIGAFVIAIKINLLNDLYFPRYLDSGLAGV